MSASDKPSRAAAMTVARAVAELHGASTMAKVVVDPFVEQLCRTLHETKKLASAAHLLGKPIAVCCYLDQLVVDLGAFLEQARKS